MRKTLFILPSFNMGVTSDVIKTDSTALNPFLFRMAFYMNIQDTRRVVDAISAHHPFMRLVLRFPEAAEIALDHDVGLATTIIHMLCKLWDTLPHIDIDQRSREFNPILIACKHNQYIRDRVMAFGLKLDLVHISSFELEDVSEDEPDDEEEIRKLVRELKELNESHQDSIIIEETIDFE